MNRYNPGDTFETHECILCKNDPDASYCIPKPDTVTLPADVVREVAEGLKELSLPPYGDSDLRSLGAWAAARATSLLALLESHLSKESKS